MNKWGIPGEIEALVLLRDTFCIYCGVAFGTCRKTMGSWEHIINDASITAPENIARCCVSCNASKGTKTLRAWLESPYCKRNRITVESVAEVVRRFNRLSKDP